MLLRGRRKIVSSARPMELESDVNYLISVVNTALQTHLLNKAEIDYLINYKNGNQTILEKTKDIRPEISNKVVINHAQMATRLITGYFLGTPIQYVQANADKKDQLELLNRVVAYEDKATVDKELAEMQSICGTAYRIVFTDDGIYEDEVPFEDRSLNPSHTFVVYENSIGERPLIGVTYLNMTDPVDGKHYTMYYCYTNAGLHTFKVDGIDAAEVKQTSEHTFTPYNVGGIPIIEYPNNIWRIGDWELIIDVMDAVNGLYSGRMDDVDQVIQSLLVFINADIDEERYQEMRQCGVVCLTNKTNDKSDVKTVGSQLDQSGMSEMAKELEDLIYALIGIPDRNNRGRAGGDTGQAVELRDGWADLEIVARNKELTFKRSEKQALKIMLTIMRNKLNLNLSLLDINIKFSRNKNNNLLVKTQAYMNLISSKTLDPADCLTIVDLVSDVNDFIERGKAFWQDEFAGKMPQQLMDGNVNEDASDGEQQDDPNSDTKKQSDSEPQK